ncbi:MAG: cysteine synthase A [Erysipelotrichaceae bacterium]|nr:cysteine synthase A [Erysipelotrichaceae bacterium]MBQ3963094.1 cysteine synthase A [Erysipelotrichaceae bacterium]MBQ5552366.1 cysteine synthase A [Erysipelotrichaceae bacterium]
MIYHSALDAIGNTPLIKLNKIVDQDFADIYVKFEALEPGGSIKTRTALGMIEDAEQKGLLNENSVIVECTSGNQGIALAMIGAIKGYRVIIVMPDSVSVERRKLIAMYGAQIRLVHDEGNIGACIEKCQQIVANTAKEDPYVFVPGQFENPANVAAQEKTGEEIVKDLPKIDGFCSGIGTGGTLTGIGKVLKKHNPDMTIWAVEPENAAILSGDKIGTHLQMGIGDGVIPDILDQKLYDDICIISDELAIGMAKLLAKKEGLLCGISSGTNVAAALKLAKKLGKGKVVVTILPDTGERYYSTPLFD